MGCQALLALSLTSARLGARHARDKEAPAPMPAQSGQGISTVIEPKNRNRTGPSASEAHPGWP